MKNSKSDLAWGIAGWLFFFCCVGGFIYYHGEHWEFGHYWMPRIIVAENGYTYTDGTLIDPINQVLIRSGREEEILLIGFISLAVFYVGGMLLINHWPVRKPPRRTFRKGGRFR